jgi:hemerythrin
MPWDPSLSTGIEKIDEQHQGLVRNFDMLQEAVEAGQSRYVLWEFLEFLELYADSHFRVEEDLMDEMRYPDFVAHKSEHNSFRTGLHAIVLRYRHKGYSASIVLEAYGFAESWLTKHLNGLDRALAAFIHAQKKDDPSSA